MALEKISVVDQIEITELRVVQVRTATRITEDGQVLARQLNRHTIAPGQDYANEQELVKAVCAAIHTPAAIQAYREATAPRKDDTPAQVQVSGPSAAEVRISSELATGNRVVLPL